MVGPVVSIWACSFDALMALAPLQSAMPLSFTRSTVIALVGVGADVQVGNHATARPHTTTSSRSSGRVPLVPQMAHSLSRRVASSSTSVSWQVVERRSD